MRMDIDKGYGWIKKPRIELQGMGGLKSPVSNHNETPKAHISCGVL